MELKAYFNIILDHSQFQSLSSNHDAIMLVIVINGYYIFLLELCGNLDL